LFDPAEAEKRRRQAADAQHVDGDLDLADALDLNDAITAGAAELGRLGCEESLDVRRSLAAGAIARRELTLDLKTDQPTPPGRKRELVIYVHLSDAGVAGVENIRSAISVEQVKEWCAGTNTHVTIRPVIDLNEDLHTDAYRPTDVMREQAVLTNATCVYPHFSRPSRSADLDHIEEFDGHNTDSTNLAPLCRRHHRYKTHAGWTVVRTGPTSFTWTSRHGYTYDWDTSHTRHTR